MLGFEYLAVLLEHPGRALKALELQALAGGEVQTNQVSGSLANTLQDDLSDEQDSWIAQSDFTEAEMIDPKTRRKAEERLREIPLEIEYCRAIKDIKKVDELEKEDLFIRSYLTQGRSRGFRPRVFLMRTRRLV